MSVILSTVDRQRLVTALGMELDIGYEGHSGALASTTQAEHCALIALGHRFWNRDKEGQGEEMSQR